MINARGDVAVNVYTVIERAVDEGVAYGWRRAHKHAEDPDESLAVDTIVTAVMDALSEVLQWPEP